MRSSAPWQSVWDDRILEVAAEDSDQVVSVSDLDEHDRVRTSKSNISKRCSILAEHGLLRKVGNGVYLITDEGVGYLNEEYDVETGMWLTDDQAAEAGPGNGETTENGVQ